MTRPGLACMARKIFYIERISILAVSVQNVKICNEDFKKHRQQHVMHAICRFEQSRQFDIKVLHNNSSSNQKISDRCKLSQISIFDSPPNHHKLVAGLVWVWH